MMNLKKGIAALIKKVATSMPPDVEAAIRQARDLEAEGSKAYAAYDRVLERITDARSDKKPICLEPGTPYIYVTAPEGIKHSEIKKSISEAMDEAAELIPVASAEAGQLIEIGGTPSKGLAAPVVEIAESTQPRFELEMMLIGASSENTGALYRLPDDELGASMDMEGVVKCAADAVANAGGKGCPPYIVGVGVGPTRDQAALLSKRQLRRKLSDENPVEKLAAAEKKILEAINSTGIGIEGKGGQTTALGVKLGVMERNPGSMFVDVSIICWNTRRGKLIW